MNIDILLNEIWSYDLKTKVELYQTNLNSVTKIHAIELNDRQVNELANRIIALPDDLYEALLLKYYFDISSDIATELFGENMMEGKAVYAHKLLSHSFELPDGFLIEDKSLDTACSIAISKYENEIKTSQMILHKPHYSRRLRRNIRKVARAKWIEKPIITNLRRVAMVFLVAIVGFSLTMIVHAGIREFVLNWARETFPVFSTFWSEGPSEALATNLDDAENIVAGYLPDEFAFIDVDRTRRHITYIYNDQKGDRAIYLQVALPGNPTNLNTENALIQNYAINGCIAEGWEYNGISYLIWHQEGYELIIIANLDIEESINFAQNIKFLS